MGRRRRWPRAAGVGVVLALVSCGGGGEGGFGAATCTDPAEDLAALEGVTDAAGQPIEPGTLLPHGAMDVRSVTVTSEAPGSLTATFRFTSPIEEALASTVDAGSEVRSWRAWADLGDVTLGVDLSGGGAEAFDLSLSPTLSGSLTARRTIGSDGEELVTDVEATVGDGEAVPVPFGSPLWTADGRGPIELDARVEGDTLTVTAAEVHRYVRDFPPPELKAAGATSFDDHKIDTCEGPTPFSD